MKKLSFSRQTALFCLTASLLILGSTQQPSKGHPTHRSTPRTASSSIIESTASSRTQPGATRPDDVPHTGVRYVLDDSGQVLTQSFEAIRYQELTEATQDFLDILSEEQRTTVLLPFDHPFRTRAFCYVLARCNDEYVGLQMADLSSAQKIALNNLMMKSFSGAGYARATQTMNREWLVEETENAHRSDPESYPTVGSPLVAEWTPPAKRSAPNYYIAFFGEPASTNPWGLRFEGHHLSFNLTFGNEGEQPVTGTSPMFFGSSPMIIPAAPTAEAGEETLYPRWQQEEGQQLLHREAWLARSFLSSLNGQTRQLGSWSELPDVVLAGGADVPLDAAAYLDGEQPGIAVADLNPVQQQLLSEFALEFLQLQSSAHIDIEAFNENMASARVWWFGNIEDEQADLYFRVQSDRYLVELLQSNTFGVVSEVASNHVHASFRDLTSDWDYNSLGAHLQQHHNTMASYESH